MKVALVFLVAVAAIVAASDFHRALLERAQDEIDKDVFDRTMSGARSPRFSRKKVTQLSKALSQRNALFRKSMQILEAEGLETAEARKVVQQALAERGHSHHKRPGGQSGQTDPVTLADDICDNSAPVCDSNSKFRTIDGRCNNLDSNKALWGSMSISLRRYLPRITSLYTLNTYYDKPSSRSSLLTDRRRGGGGKGGGGGGKGGGGGGKGGGGGPKPDSTDNPHGGGGGSDGSGDSCSSNSLLKSVKCFGVPKSQCSCQSRHCVHEAPVELPNARVVSTKFHEDDASAEDAKVTHMVTQFGQFLDHDLVLTPEEEAHDCCVHPESDPYCFPIQVSPNDYFYSGVNVNCLEFSRSTGFCDDAANLDSANHEQLNAITAFVDASNVYGSTTTESNDLRSHDGSGKLKMDDNLLPRLGLDNTIKAGDVRAREMPGLATMHTLFVREHNRICDALKELSATDAGWTDEDFFQNARRILIAEMQKIVYGEYLPVVMGDEGIKQWHLTLNKDSDYNANVDPSISNSFATAAYRFGHSMIQGLISMYNTNSIQEYKQYELGNNYFNMTNYEYNGGLGMEQILTGLIKQNAQAHDRHVSVEVTNKLFANVDPNRIGGDLVARNIQRGRDHGLPSYAAYYKQFAPSDSGAMDCWGKKPQQISSNNWNLLKKVYVHPHHIDLFVGGLAEKPFKGGLTGATFQGIKGKQFRDLKHGDRFFFTHRGNMNGDEYNQIMGRSLGDIICDNTGISRVPSNVFLVDSPLKDCSSYTPLNIGKFQLFKV